jgi:hypothetical protein
MIGDAGTLAHVGEGPITIVVEQPTGHRLVHMRNTVAMFSVLAGATVFVLQL